MYRRKCDVSGSTSTITSGTTDVIIDWAMSFEKRLETGFRIWSSVERERILMVIEG